MAIFPVDSVRTKTWTREVLASADLHTQLDLLHFYFQACLNASTGHTHSGSANQGPKLSDSSLNTITTAAKVNVSAITGTLPVGNGGTGSTAAANAASGVVVLDASSKLPAVDGSLLTNLPAQLTSYDSGWFAVTKANAYSKTHNLNTTKILVMLYFSTSSDGSGMELFSHNYPDSLLIVKDITTTTLKVQTGTGYSAQTFDDSGNYTSVVSGYARVIAIALP